MAGLVQKQRFRHFSGFEIATFFDEETGSEYFGPRQFFEYHIESKGSPQKTVDAAIQDLFLFLKFLKVCSDLQIRWGNWMGDTGAYLNRILLMYPTFLAEAQQSPNKFVVEVARELDFNGLAISSVGRHVSTVNSFINFNNEEWISHQALVESLELDTFVTEGGVLAQIAQQSSLSISEKRAMLTKSMLGGVISGGPKKTVRPKLKVPRRFRSTQEPSEKLYMKSFPLDKVIPLIESASSYRDICLFSLLAGTGVRTHEAMQMRTEDVLAYEETVKILPYAERIEAYTDLDDVQVTALSFKGRTSSDVTFLQPFKDIFFNNLMNYLVEERDKTHPRHDFLFVTIANNSNGNPWFLADSTSHNVTFKSTQRRLKMDRIFSLHSLRHFYGTWLHNYAPNGQGYGYPIKIVQRAMGHSFETTTEGYAIPDRQLYLNRIKEIDKAFQKHGFNFDLVQHLAKTGGSVK